MGGNAFRQVYPSARFPRFSTTVYDALKARLTPRLQTLYEHVTVPFEAPEKLTHGDLDFLVAVPRTTPSKLEITTVDVKEVLGATLANEMEGNRTSNYALSVGSADLSDLDGPHDGQESYYQVDVHVCEDKPEMDRVAFFHSYGDLGMIIGLIARHNGLSIGQKGFKVC